MFSNRGHGDAFSIAASPPFQSHACCGNYKSKLTNMDINKKMENLTKFLILLSLAFSIVGCGGGNAQVEDTPTPAPATSVTLNSDAGDYIGQGNNYEYSLSNAAITVTNTGSRLVVRIDGDESWSATFQLPDGYSELQPGSYGNLTRYPFHDSAKGGLSWSGEGRGCNTLTGWIIIDKVTYNESVLEEVELQFEQHCEGGAAALRGDMKWYLSDSTLPSGPIFPLPDGLWKPAPEDLPESGNYAYLESTFGDYIGGNDYTFLDSDNLTVTSTDNYVTVSVGGWIGAFKGMNSITRIEQGYYADLQRFPFHNPAKGGLSWSGNGRGCNQLNGWFIVDSVAYIGSDLNSIDLRFEQYCDGAGSALNGKVHWSQ